MAKKNPVRVRRAARLRELLNLYGERMGDRHGWKSEAARVLGLSQSHFSRILTGSVIPGFDTFDGVARAMGVRPAYYDAPAGTAPTEFLVNPDMGVGSHLEMERELSGFAEVRIGPPKRPPTPEETKRMDGLAHAIFVAQVDRDKATLARLAVELAAAVTGYFES